MAGLVPAIHVFRTCPAARRGCQRKSGSRYQKPQVG